MNNIKTKAVELIKNYMGNETAKLYAGFYQDQEEENVLMSVSELLTEYIGSSQAKEVLIKNGLIKN